MWFLPSLGRPEKLQEVMEACSNSHIYVYLHRGDERLPDYYDLPWPRTWEIKVGERLGLCDALNWCIKEFPDEWCYGLMADDVIPLQEDWSIQLETASGMDYLAYPDDLVHGEKLCTHHCIGGDLMRRVGYWAVPGLKHSFLDTAWYQMAGSSGLLRYLPYIQFDHRHPVVGKSDVDDTYEIGQSSYEEDMQVFQEWQYDGFPEAVDRINQLPEEVQNGEDR